MPKTPFQKFFYSFVTVIITVCAFVFYSLYVIEGETLMQANNATSVLSAIDKQGGIYMFGHILPLPVMMLIEVAFALVLSIFIGSPTAFKLASKAFPPQNSHPTLFELAIICSTAFVMCPLMSLIASIAYYPYYNGFNLLTLLANWIQLVCHNFPFALLSQVFFIQPVVRRIFAFAFCREKAQTDKATLANS